MATRDELTAAMRKALEKGNKPLAQAIGAKLTAKEYEEVVPDWQSAALGAAQGATFGLSDEIWAGLRAGFDRFLEGEPFKESYEQRLEENRALLEEARREDPWAMGLGEVGGGLLTGGAGMGRALAGQGLRQIATRGLATGAGMGGLAGYGYSEGDPLAAALMGEEGEFLPEAAEALTDVTEGAMIGGPLGMLMPAAGMGLRSAARFATRPFTKGRRMTEANRQAIVEAVEKDIQGGAAANWDDVSRKLAEDPTMTIADIGPNTRAMAEQLMHSGTAAGTQFRNFVKTRNVNQWRRMHPRIAEALGDPQSKTFGQAKKKLLNDAKVAANEMYDTAYAQDVRITPRMADYLATPEFANIQRKAQRLYAADMVDQGYRLKDLPPIDLANTTQNTRHVDYVLRAMDDKVSKLFRAGDKQAAITAKNLRNKFRQEVYDQNSFLAKARNQWASDMKVNDAMEQGRKIFREDFEMVGDMMDDMTMGERVGFRIGVAKALTDRLGNKPFDADITKGVFNVPNKREAVKAAFGSKQKFDNFMKYVNAEQDKFELFRLAGGSETGRRVMSQQDVMEQMAALGGYSFGLSAGGGIPPSIAGNIAKRMYTGARDIIGATPWEDLMVKRGELLQAPSLEALQQPKLLGGLLATGVPRTSAELTGGILASGLLQDPEAYGGL